MLKRYLEQRHIDLDSGRSCLALEREYWQALEVLAYEDGWNNWRDFFYMRVLTDKPENISLASQVRRMVTVFLFRLSTKKGSRLAAFF
jgi:predicted DNA-binding ribbon-helix-helix protein